MYKTDFNSKIKDIMAIHDEDVKLPNMPIGEAVQEVENQVAW